MRKTITLGWVAAVAMLVPAFAGATVKTVEVKTAGTLSSLIPASEKNEVTDLTVSGKLNGDDVLYIREMAGQDAEGNATQGKLTDLNLSGVELADGGGAYYQDSWSSYYTATSYDVSEDEDEYYCTDLSYAFSGTNLKSVVWPATMWEVGEDALSYCTDLASFTLGSETNEIKSRAFYGCSALAGITLTDKILYVDDYAFAGCSSLKSIALPSEVETIYRNTFAGCKALESVTLGSAVSDIRENAFDGCSSLKSIDLPAALTKLGNAAFDGCSALKAITLPKKLRTLGDGVFEGCTSLGSIDVADGNANFASSNGVLYNKAMTRLIVCPVGKTGSYAVPEGVEEISASAFSRCSGLTALTLPESLATIGNEAFYRCTSLGSLALPNGVTSVGENAFYRCSSLKSVTLGKGMTAIGASMFYYCNGLESIVVPEGYTSIGYEAFASCSALKQVELPSTIASIGAEAFSGCSALATATVKVKMPVAISADVFDGVDLNTCRLLVPPASIDAYKADAQWGRFKLVEPIVPTGVHGVEAAAASVSVSGGVLTVAGADSFSVYTATGRMLCSGTTGSVTLPGRGCYVVVAGGKAVKVMY